MLTAFAPAAALAASFSSHSPVAVASEPPSSGVELVALGQFDSGDGETGAEIPAYDPATQRLFSTNGAANALDIIDVSDPQAPQLVESISLAEWGTDVQSVAVGDGVVAVALDDESFTQDDSDVWHRTRHNGKVAVFDTDGEFQVVFEVGNLPDMIAFTPDRSKIVVANEAEVVCEYEYAPDGSFEPESWTDEWVADPEGSVSVIDLASGTVDHATFDAFNGQKDALRAAGVRIFDAYANNPDYTVAEDIEPEYVTVSADGTTAYVSLQENNAIAVVDIETATVTDIYGLGYKDHTLAGMGLDPSDEDDPADPGESGVPNVGPWNVSGMYMPDTISEAVIGGATYLFSANEGDAREWPCGINDDFRVKDFADLVEPIEADYDDDASGLPLDATEQEAYDEDHADWSELIAAHADLADFAGFDASAYPDVDGQPIDEDHLLGRLKTTFEYPTVLDADGEIAEIYAMGARSFSIWDADGELVFDSGDDFATLLADTPFFNLDEDTVDGRSDDKGAEPEAIEVGEIAGRTYAFVGLERSGGVMAYDVTDPANATHVAYANTQSDDYTEGDVSPEGIVFIPAHQSPNGAALIAVSYEVTGTIRLFQVNVPDGELMAPVVPTRVLDTRPKSSATVGTTYDGIGEGDGPVAPATSVTVQIGGRAGVPATATAVSLNVTATEASGAGHLTIWPCDQARPLASSVNYTASTSVANSVIVPLAGDGRICIASAVSDVHVVADVTAWSASTERYEALSPARLLDTRPETSPTSGVTVDGEARGQGPLEPGDRITLDVAGRGGVNDDARAVAINITATGAAGPGYFTVWPCDATTKPVASTLNFSGPAAVANSVVVPLSAAGTLCIESGVSAAHVVADVTGGFAHSDEFHGLVPARLIDTRPTTSPTSGTTVDGNQQSGGALGGGEQLVIEVGGRGHAGSAVPANARLVALNLVATGSAGPGYLTAWPCDAERPTASSVNYATGSTAANSIVVALSAESTVCVYAGASATHVVADVTAAFL